MFTGLVLHDYCSLFVIQIIWTALPIVYSSIASDSKRGSRQYIYEQQDDDDSYEQENYGEHNENNKRIVVSHDPNDVRFHQYSATSYDEIECGRFVPPKNFNPNVVTVIFIHGFLDTYNANGTTLRLMRAYVNSGIPGNFIVVNWDKLSSPTIDQVPVLMLAEMGVAYLAVLPNLPIVAEKVTEFISCLMQHGLQLSRLHLIGHSLGAHISGETGAMILNLHGERIRRITGLDPAGPLLEFPIRVKPTLNSENANFVDAIHTNFGVFGTVEPNGDVDIYANNGVVQPGCKNSNVVEVIRCSHEFGFRIYAAGFVKPEVACYCNPPWKYFVGECINPCEQPTVVGPYTPETARGFYHLETTSDPDYEYLAVTH